MKTKNLLTKRAIISMPPARRKFYQELKDALDDFPKIVAEKKKRYRERQKFLNDTFGDLVRLLEKRRKKAGKD